MNGQFNESYTGPRRDLLAMVPSSVVKVLDIGCSTGAFSKEIRMNHTASRLVGVEVDPQMAHEAKDVMDRVEVANLNHIRLSGVIDERGFDLVVMGDVLEHLIDPWGVIEDAVELMSPGGIVIASVPNVRHVDTIWNLLFKGDWPYRDRGIHDRTHLRYFTKAGVLRLLSTSGLKIQSIDANYRLLDRPSPVNRKLTPVLSLPLIRNFFAYQYLVVARKPATLDGGETV